MISHLNEVSSQGCLKYFVNVVGQLKRVHLWTNLLTLDGIGGYMTEAQIREWLRSLYIGREGIKSTMANVSLTRVGQIIELETVYSVRKYYVDTHSGLVMCY